MDIGNYVNDTEAVSIASALRTLKPVWDLITQASADVVSFEVDSALVINVYDSNGESLGCISFGEDGFGWFPNGF